MTSLPMFLDGHPITFAEWLAVRRGEGQVNHATCITCGEGEPISADGVCLACLNYQFGFDQASEAMLRAMIRGAVAAALDAGAAAPDVLRFAGEAIDHYYSDMLQGHIKAVAR